MLFLSFLNGCNCIIQAPYNYMYMDYVMFGNGDAAPHHADFWGGWALFWC